jgi:hypothetical protein
MARRLGLAGTVRGSRNTRGRTSARAPRPLIPAPKPHAPLGARLRACVRCVAGECVRECVLASPVDGVPAGRGEREGVVECVCARERESVRYLRGGEAEAHGEAM